MKPHVFENKSMQCILIVDFYPFPTFFLFYFEWRFNVV